MPRSPITTYGTLCTEFYDLDKPEPPPDAFDFYVGHARRAQGPILEAMCGSGRFLVPLLAQGLAVAGVDSSGPMLASCRRRAAALGLEPELHQVAIEELAFDRRFALAFVAVGSFSLLTDDDQIERALAGLYRALVPGGTLLVEVERAVARAPSAIGTWGGTWLDRPDGSRIVLSWLPQYSGVEAISRSLHRYELVREGRLLETEFHELALKHHEEAAFTDSLRLAGFEHVRSSRPYDGAPPDADDDALVFECRRPDVERA